MLEFFASPAWDSAGVVEGQTYLGAATLTTDPAGNAIFSVTLPVAVPADHLITATATDPAGNTSAFSAGIPITAGQAGVSLSVTRSSSGQTSISWPTAATGFQLEAAASLQLPIQWYPVTNGISDDGTLKTFTILGGSLTNEFFRLKR